MFEIINFLKDSLIAFLFLLFLERCFGLTTRHLLIYILSTTFGYYFGYRFGQRLRHTQVIIEISERISRLKNEFGNWIQKSCNYLNVLPEKAITGESLAIEIDFLNKLQNKILKKEQILSIWSDVYKKEMFVWFSTYDGKEILKSTGFRLIFYMSEIFGEHRESRFLGWCANYDMKTYSDGARFYFKNYLVHRNSNNLLKELSIKYWNFHFCQTFFNFLSLL